MLQSDLQKSIILALKTFFGRLRESKITLNGNHVEFSNISRTLIQQTDAKKRRKKLSFERELIIPKSNK